MEGQVSGDIGGSTEVFVSRLRWRRPDGSVAMELRGGAGSGMDEESSGARHAIHAK